MNDIPPGFLRISGKRAPSDKGQRYYVKLRNGMQPPESWPVKNTRWVHDGSDFDIIAVRKA